MLSDLSTLKHILSYYQINHEVDTIKPLAGGRQHDSWLIKLKNSGAYVLKQLSLDTYLGRLSPEHFNKTEQFAYQAQHHFKQQVAKVICALSYKTNHFVLEYQGCHYMLFPHINATPKSVLTLKQCYLMGQSLAVLHQIAPQPISLPAIKFKPFAYQNWQRSLTDFISDKKQLDDYIALSKQARQCGQQPSQQQLLSHRDLNVENILWLSETEPYLIDWECSGLINPKVELIGLAFNLAGLAPQDYQFSKFNAVIEGYLDNAAPQSSSSLFVASDYVSAYLSWFAWLNFCLDANTVLAKAERQQQIKLTLEAIKTMQLNQQQILKVYG